MSKIRIFIWFAVFLSILIIFNLGLRMVYTPAGQMGENSNANVIASCIYLISWLVLSVVAGVMGKREILVAALIYSALPLLGLLGVLFMGTPLAILIIFYFYWSVPIQGLSAGNEQFIGVILILQPLIFLLGYFFFNSLRDNTYTKEQ